MKYFTILIITTYQFYFVTAQQQIQLSKGSFKTFKSNIVPESVADSALNIANIVYNSQDFKDSLEKLNFVEDNNSGCNNDIKPVNGIISGNSVYTQLFKNSSPIINIIVRRSGWSELGVTPLCTNNIKSFYKNIMNDMRNFSFAYGLAVNICHEYMHSLGYCHFAKMNENSIRPDGEKIDPVAYNADIAYRIGWITYDILNRWLNQHRLPFDK